MKNQNPVHVFATWKVKEGHIETVLNLLKTVHDESVKEKGNLFYKIHQNNLDLNTLILFEGYINEAAISEHRNSAHFQKIILEKIVPLLENREITLTIPIDYTSKK
jgi:quinol monooxygenase YgiN